MTDFGLESKVSRAILLGLPYIWILDCPYSFLIGDGICNDENNNADCMYDDGDCCLTEINTSNCLECACASKGIITSPRIPNPTWLWTTTTTTWLIQTHIGQFIMTNLVYQYNIHGYSCRWVFFSYSRGLKQLFLIYFHSSYFSLSLYDGNSNTAPLIDQYCGQSYNRTEGYQSSHISSSNSLFIQFKSISRFFSRSGSFQLEYHPYSKHFPWL